MSSWQGHHCTVDDKGITAQLTVSSYSILSTECCVADDFSAIECITLSRECDMADKLNTIIYIS